MEQLQFDFEGIGSLSVKPIEKIKFPRPEHKPYEPSNPIPTDERGRTIFEIQGAFLNELHLRSACTGFLEQKSKDPSLQKAIDFRWETGIIKMPAYHWREYENGVSYNCWCTMYDEHLIGWTDNHFEAYDWERDYITALIEEGVTSWDNFQIAFFETLRGFRTVIEAGREMQSAWDYIVNREKLQC